MFIVTGRIYSVFLWSVKRIKSIEIKLEVPLCWDVKYTITHSPLTFKVQTNTMSHFSNIPLARHTPSHPLGRITECSPWRGSAGCRYPGLDTGISGSDNQAIPLKQKHKNLIYVFVQSDMSAGESSGSADSLCTNWSQGPGSTVVRLFWWVHLRLFSRGFCPSTHT